MHVLIDVAEIQGLMDVELDGGAKGNSDALQFASLSDFEFSIGSEAGGIDRVLKSKSVACQVIASAIDCYSVFFGFWEPVVCQGLIERCAYVAHFP